MWAKLHFNRFLRWVLTTLLSIIFPFATIKNPGGSRQQQKSYRKLPVQSAINSDLKSDTEVEENVADKSKGSENEDASINEKRKDSNMLKECNQGHADHDNVDVNVDVPIDVDAVIAALGEGSNMTFIDTFNKQLCGEKYQQSEIDSDEYDFESCKKRVEDGSQDPKTLATLAKMYLFNLGGAPLNVVNGCELMGKYLRITLEEEKDKKDPTKIVNRACDPRTTMDFLAELGGHLLGAPTTTEPKQYLPKEMLDGARACELYKRAANDYNDILSTKVLGGKIYMTGQYAEIGAPFDLDEGMYWLLRGAKMGDGQSAFQLAGIFASKMVPINIDLHIQWLLVADKFGYEPEAQQFLELAYACQRRERNPNHCHACSWCKVKEKIGGKKFLKCSKCKNALYCSRECQVKHFKMHNTECKRSVEYTEAVEMIHNKIDEGTLKAYPDWELARMK